MQTYSESRVAEALAALELNGGNVKRTAIQLQIPRKTLESWRDQFATVATVKRDLTAEKAERWAQIGPLFVEYLGENLRASIVISKFVSDPKSVPEANHTWLAKQHAEGLGMFYGIMNDKARLLGQSMEHAALERQQLQLEAGASTTDGAQ